MLTLVDEIVQALSNERSCASILWCNGSFKLLSDEIGLMKFL